MMIFIRLAGSWYIANWNCKIEEIVEGNFVWIVLNVYFARLTYIEDMSMFSEVDFINSNVKIVKMCWLLAKCLNSNEMYKFYSLITTILYLKIMF